MENRNIYDDNIYDINSLEDIKDLDQIFLLSNDDKNFKFRLGADFFSFNKEDIKLTQYPDYKSLIEDKTTDGKRIYSDGFNINNDYSENIIVALSNLNLNQFKHFDLENKDSFYINKDELGISVKLNGGAKVKKANQNLNEIVDKFDALKQQELKPINDIIKAFASIVSLFFLINLKKRKKEDNEIIGMIIEELNANRLKVDDLLNDSNLLNRVPNLKEALEEYKKSYVQDLDFSLDDNGFINNSPNNILMLEIEKNKIETLLLEYNVAPFLMLENPKNTNALNDLIAENNDTMSFIKDFIIKDNTLNYDNYTSNEIAGAAMLAGIKTDLKVGKFNLEDNLFADFKELVHTNDLDIEKVSILSDNLINKFTSFVLVNENEIVQNSKLGI